MSLKQYTPAHLKEVKKLMSAKSSKVGLWQWQFSRWQQKPPLLAYHNGELVGFNGVMPIQIKRKNKELQGIWSCDFFVDKKSRKLGVGSAIKDKLKLEYPSIIMSLGISDSALSVLKRKGWKSKTGVNTYRRKRLLKGMKNTVIGLLQSSLATIFKPVTKSQQTFNINLRAALPYDKELDQLWLEVQEDYGSCIIRNAKYLNWRYTESKQTSYRFLTVRDQEKLVAILVYSKSPTSVSIVDYIGPRKNSFIKYKLLKYLEQTESEAENFDMVTSDTHWRPALYASGYFRSLSYQRFVIYSSKETELEKDDWFITSGDSDGELIKNYSNQENNPHCANEGQTLTVKQLSEDEFQNLEYSWQALLNSSNANPLFMSWSWQYSWWETWSQQLNLNLKLLACYQGNNLVGLLPLYEGKFNSELFNSKKDKLSFIGSNWRNEKTFRTEFSSPIISPIDADKITAAFVSHLNRSHPSHEIVISDANIKCPNVSSLISGFEQSNAAVLVRQIDKGVFVDTHLSSFEGYRQSLSINARRAIFNNRKRLLKEHPSITTELLHLADIKDFFAILNKFHQERWGKHLFTEEVIAFNQAMLQRLLQNNSKSKLLVSLLKSNNTILSAQYNIEINDQVINLQSGFLSDFDSKVALGLVHFGITLESLFNSPVSKFDFLVGEGKKSDYKNKFSSQSYELTTIQVIRSRPANSLYKLYKITPTNIRKFVLHSFKKIK